MLLELLVLLLLLSPYRLLLLLLLLLELAFPHGDGAVSRTPTLLSGAWEPFQLLEPWPFTGGLEPPLTLTPTPMEPEGGMGRSIVVVLPLMDTPIVM